MEFLEQDYNHLLKIFNAWRLLSEKWLILVRHENYVEATINKFQVDSADEEYKQHFNQLMKNLEKAEDQQVVTEISDKMKNLNLSIC